MGLRAFLERRHADFDRWAPSYDRSLLQPLLFHPTHSAVLKAAADAAGRPRQVLDIGCGTGALLERAAVNWHDAQLVGIDAAPTMIAEARRKRADDPRFRFEVADAASLPLASDSVDVAFSTLSFHHWSEQAGGLREIARVLRPGGIFVLADLQPVRILRPVMRGFHGERARQTLFEANGLAVVDQQEPLRFRRQVLVTVGRKPLST